MINHRRSWLTILNKLFQNVAFWESVGTVVPGQTVQNELMIQVSGNFPFVHSKRF